jgi:hypothetical protein
MHLPNALLVVTSYNEGNRSVALSGRDGLPRFPGLKPWAVLLNHFMVNTDFVVWSHTNSERVIWSLWLVPLLGTAFPEG